MRKSFSVGQANELLQGGTSYDLHNRYDFVHLSVSSTSTLELLFRPHPEYGLGLPSIRIEAVDIDFLELSEGFGTRTLLELAELGYKEPGDTELDWLLGEKHATPREHLVLRFSAEDYVRFHAREVSLICLR